MARTCPCADSDVYQYRVLTSFSALKELLAVIEKTQQGLFTTDDNIDACRLETLYILKQDNYDVFVALYRENQKGILAADVLSSGIISLI